MAELRGTGQFNGNTESGRISMELGNLKDPAVDDNLADYYWCEINDLRTGNIHQSDRVFIRAKGALVVVVVVCVCAWVCGCE